MAGEKVDLQGELQSAQKEIQRLRELYERERELSIAPFENRENWRLAFEESQVREQKLIEELRDALEYLQIAGVDEIGKDVMSNLAAVIQKFE